MSRFGLTLLLLHAFLSAALNAQSVFGSLAQDQSTPSTAPARPAGRTLPAIKYAAIGGVLTNANGQPMRRGLIALTAHSTGIAGQSAETDDQGRFRFAAVSPGIYSISASRDGYLTAEYGTRGGIRMPRQFGIYESERWEDVSFRLEPWGVIAGKVKFGDDAEPAMRVPVFAYRKRFWHGTADYLVAANTRTDDRGEYRLSGLRPGEYIIAAIYDRPRKPTASEEPPQQLYELDRRVAELPPNEPSYASTFFTNATRVSEAAPLEMKPGVEMTGVDLFLSPAQSTRIRGRITDGCTGKPTVANVEVFRVTDGEVAAIRANTQLTIGPTSFAVQGLAPGAYALFVSKDADKDCPTQTYRRTFFVNESPFDNIEVSLRPVVRAEFSLRLDVPSASRQRAIQLASGIQLRLYPRYRQIRPITLSFDQTGVAYAQLDQNESYTVTIERGPADAYLEQPLVIDGSPGQFPLTVSLRGARAAGQVTGSNDKPVPGASVTLIPQSSARLAQPFPEGFAELDGGAFVQGIAPGTYVAVPWLDSPPCDFHNPNAFEACLPFGTRADFKAGEEKILPLKLKLR